MEKNIQNESFGFLSFNDMVALYALDRPYIDISISMFFQARKNPVKNSFPLLDEILQDTYGLLIFQEQSMGIAQRIGGFSQEASESLCRAMGKKESEELEKMKPVFIDNAVENGYTEQQSTELYQWMTDRSPQLFKRKAAESAIKQWLGNFNSAELAL